MPITKRELKEILNRLGFTEIRSKHHIFFELHISNRIIRTKISHGSERDISDALLSHILKEQIYLTKEEFESAKRGLLSEKEYLEILKKKRIID
jgi:hypothetical protein